MDRDSLLSFIRTQRLAVQASVTADAAPQAAIVGFAITDKFEIVFDTLADARKVHHLRANARIAMVIGGWHPGDERTVQLEGIVDEPKGNEFARLLEVYYAVDPDGRSRAAEMDLTYLRVKPKWIRYSDFNQNPPVIEELVLH